MLVDRLSSLIMREGEELKAPRHASAAATRDHITTRNIVPTLTIYYITLLLFLVL